MSKRSADTKRRSKNTVTRSKRSYPTARRAMNSLEKEEGLFPHNLIRARHTGTYWMWEVRR